MDPRPAPSATPVRLRDGRSVTIRPLRADDDLRERAFIEQLSDESRYQRFQKWVHSPSDRLVRFLTDIDPARHVALAAVARGDGGEEEIVGQARYVLQPDGETCELGIVVADAWRSSGLAGVLMAALIDAARASGLKRMEGLVLATNRPMLRFVRALGFGVETIEEDRTMVRISKPL